MKTAVHPRLNHVIFHDIPTGAEWMSRSTATSPERRVVDGVEAYVIRLDISSASHPAWTGQQRIVDTAGRVERFERRYRARNAG
jgi:large subunit ribosomal protein L31